MFHLFSQVARELQIAQRRSVLAVGHPSLISRQRFWAPLRYHAHGRLAQRRAQLAVTTALYQAQLERIGAVQTTLLRRPSISPGKTTMYLSLSLHIYIHIYIYGLPQQYRRGQDALIFV